MAAEVSIKGATIEVGVVRSLNIPVITGLLCLYDVSADGQRFLPGGCASRAGGLCELGGSNFAAD